MSWGIIAATTIAAGVSYAGAQSAAGATRDAANTQAAAADRSAQIMDETQRRLEARMDPYIQTGRAADVYINALLGLPAPGPVGSATQAVSGQAYSERELRDAYPELWDTWSGWERAGNSRTNGHRTIYGDFAGYVSRERGAEALFRPAVDLQPPQGTSLQPSQADRDAAMSAYAASPWAVFARESAETARRNANEAFMSSAGARGSIISGRTAAGLQEIAQEAEDMRFREGFTQGWFPAMTGVSDRGYNASVGVGNSSLSTASQIGAAGERGAGAIADGMRQSADIMATGVNSALYYGGQAFDAIRNRPTPKVVGGAKPTSYPKPTGGAKAVYGGG